MSSKLHESNASMWSLAVPPILWAAHFLLSYCTAAIWCAKFAGESRSLSTARALIALYTALALAGLFITALRGYRGHQSHTTQAEHHEDSAPGRYRFMGYAAMLLSLLSAIAVLYAALVVLIIRSCH